MLELVPVLNRRAGDYEPLVGTEVLDEAKHLADRLHGRRILHVNATAYGGGVAELLASAVPLTRALGLEADWRVIEGSEAFFEVPWDLLNAYPTVYEQLRLLYRQDPVLKG